MFVSSYKTNVLSLSLPLNIFFCIFLPSDVVTFLSFMHMITLDTAYCTLQNYPFSLDGIVLNRMKGSVKK